MPTIKQNLKPLQDGLGDALMLSLQEVLGGAAADIDGPARIIAARLAIAARRNRPALVEECKDQLALLVIENELRALDGKEDMLDFVIGKGIDALFGVAVGGLASLSVAG